MLWLLNDTIGNEKYLIRTIALNYSILQESQNPSTI
jgi:hypothetical protein